MSPPTGPLIRLALLDDNGFLRHAGGVVRSESATFHRFAEAVATAGGFAPIDYLIPVEESPEPPPPGADPIDQTRLRVVPTAPFDGIAGYLRSAPTLVKRNWPVIRLCVEQADLVWIKAPASNAALAALACRRSGVPRFTWVAGSVREVVSAQRRSGPGGAMAMAAATVYDATTRWLERSGPAIRLDGDLFTSVTTRAEVEASRSAGGRSSHDAGAIRIAWAGRVAREKGIDDLLAAVARLRARGLAVQLDLIGDGPEAQVLAGRAVELGLNGAVRFRGHVGDRADYLDALREADMFVFPSRAEGVPKVVVEAMAAGLPVIATRVGRVDALLGDGRRGILVEPGRPDDLARVIAGLAAEPDTRERLRASGLAYAEEHTAEAQAERLVAWMRRTFPNLAWPRPEAA